MTRLLLVLATLLTVTSDALGFVSIYAENDFFASRDYEYTHGTKFSYDSGQGWGAYLWQGIYTPKDKGSLFVVPGDRPYAGWLAAGLENKYYWNNIYQLSEVSVGVVGPSSLSEQSQIGIHKILNNKLPKGWDDQLHDEPAITLRHEARKDFLIFGVNEGAFSSYLVPQAEVVCGTVMDYVGVGCDILIGYHPNPHFANQISLKKKDIRKWGAFVFAGCRGRAVAWNMLLDGNMWHDSPSVDSEPLTGDLQVGACVDSPWFSLAFTFISRAKEFETQGRAEKFGAIVATFDR